ncbi:MAG: CHAT domain-containing protein, partial [Chitinophagaceae bacterium]|nr:CHAT domain-containing protein [Chitinophagaceae bacterium]
MHSQYADRILAFEHRTLTESPLKNTQDLVSALPDDCSIDLITTSRGGLVGDILSRFFHSDSAEKGFTSTEIDALKAENRIDDINAIRDTAKLLEKKNIRISRYIRVACPAAGTTLASRRMDHFFNTTLNLLGLATGWMANPVYTAFRNLVSAVLKSKNDVNLLPGLEAMNPDSPFIKILNTPPVTGGYPRINIDNYLHVISGYCVHQFRLKGLLIIASKLFFRKRNDLVVNTASMYKGTNRLKKVFFFADSQRETDHFSYFENPDTRQAIVQVLITEPGAAIPGFKLVSEVSQAELDRQALLNLEGGEYSEGSVSGKKPIVILLPGIMGSSLRKNGQRIWINYFKFITGALPELRMKEKGIEATGLIRTSYASLGAFLKNENFDVVTFAYDWRLPLTESAARFNEEVQKLLVHKQPIKIMAHSMGGVLVRDFMLGHPDTWKGLSQSDGFKLIFLGSPLGGSFRIPYVLFGKDSIIKTLGRVDLLNSRKKLLGIFSRFQGLLNLMPIDPEQGHDFGDQAHWNMLKAVFGDDKWPIPEPTDLGDFKKYRDNILARQDTIDYQNIVYVAGQDTSTPAGIRIEGDGGSRSMVFLHTAEGDQSVTWDSGIPKALVESNQVYYVPVTHGKLANEPSLFKGFLEILQTGSTRQFSTKRPVVPATQKLFRGIEDDEFNISPSDVEQSLLGLTTEEMIQESNPPLSVSVVHGDLRFSNYPVLLGHFKNDGILQAEKAVDSLLGGELAKRHRLGLYPGDIGQHVLILPQQGEFKGSLVAGLGTPDKVTAFQLSQSVEKSLTYYLLQLNGNEQSGKFSGDAKIGISSLLLCSGYGGISIENSVRAIVLAARKANENILKSHGDAPKLLECIEFIELYHDKALTCFRALKKLENENDISLRIAFDPVYLKKRPGRSKRLLYNDTAEWWTRVTVEYRKPDTGSADPGNDAMILNFSMSTSGAREEKRTLLHNRKVIDSLFGMLSSSKQYSTDLAKTIFELIIPNDFKEDLKKQKNILWILDKTTAGYPWEMLQDAVHNAHPLSVSAKMIRQLSTMDYSTQINQIANNNALVIADPLLQGYAPQLPGALAEGKVTCESLEAEGYSVRFLANAKSEDIIVALYSNEYKIVHLAGHGMFNPDTPIESG